MVYYENSQIILSDISNMGIGSLWIEWIFSIIYALIVILVLAYLAIKFASKTKRLSNANSNIKIIESIGIGYQSVIQLIKIGDKYILIGVSKDKVTYLTEVDEQHLDFSKDDSIVDKIPFDKYLKGFLNKNGGNNVD